MKTSFDSNDEKYEAFLARMRVTAPGPTKRVAIPFTNDDVPKFLAALDRFEKKSMEHFSCQRFHERPSPRSAT